MNLMRLFVRLFSLSLLLLCVGLPEFLFVVSFLL